ncbi:DNA cytosine methyltransferase [Paenibacillus xylaniclasticus]|uniref:DNA cytosine methyltransferase n=1 Tax=Paenibacillus xylaniclasticus TaxID=588083 RepID=UPI0013DF79A5|nr:MULTISPECIES: DNA (cytosine-5-)-methyltransferase [Paenibacillus]GFN32394.1 cytosine-specific methyltransferase [Paenibacillus curdlanolyticus]
MKLLSLFSGIGAYEEALKNIGVDFELVNYCEIDKVASKSYAIIHDVEESKNLGDITKVEEHKLLDFDLMTYSFPCQDISALGKQDGLYNSEGLKTRSGLFFDALRIAKYKQPKYMIAENVKALVNNNLIHQFDMMVELLDDAGYNTYWKVLNSKDYGIPHSRNRLFIVSIRKDIDDGSFAFPNPIQLIKKASDYYDDEVSQEHYINTDKQMKYISEFRLKKKYSSLNADVIICQTTKQGNLSNPQNFVKDEKGYRVMTSRELLALQGFKKEYADKLLKNGITKEQIGKMSGNSVTVSVLECIFENLLLKDNLKP